MKWVHPKVIKVFQSIKFSLKGTDGRMFSCTKMDLSEDSAPGDNFPHTLISGLHQRIS